MNSTLSDVWNANWPAPTTTDIKNWNKLAWNLTTNRDISSFVGLFGLDLTGFMIDCATNTKECDTTYWSNYDGWAIGVGLNNAKTWDVGVVIVYSGSQVINWAKGNSGASPT